MPSSGSLFSAPWKLKDSGGENGLNLIIHDGGNGLSYALCTVYPSVYEQRCLFHKSRSLHSAIQLPDHLTPRQRRRHRKAVLKSFRAIRHARRNDTVFRRYPKVGHAYRQSRPKGVATLRRDFCSTATYHRLEEQFPAWSRWHLRTTTRLESFKRRCRRCAGVANAHHSDHNILPVVIRVGHEFHAAHHEA